MTHDGTTGEFLGGITDATSAKSAISRLSLVEQIVLSGLANGESSKSLAEKMKVEVPAIDILRATVRRKLNAVSTADAVRIALLGELAGRLGYERR